MTRVALSSVALLFLLAGCGDDDGAAPDAGPLPVDQCTSGSDIAIIAAIASAADGGIPDGGVPDGGPYPTSFEAELSLVVESCTNTTCLPNILSETGVAECLVDCLAGTPAADISPGCLECHAEALKCATDNCLNPCLGTDRALCEACALENCGPRLGDCTGLPIAGLP